MNELLDPFESMLEAISPPAVVRAIEGGAPVTALWQAIDDSGYLDALLSEGQCGAGLSLSDISPLLCALGRHAVPAPVAETMIARKLLADADMERPSGAIALAVARSNGSAIIPMGLVADHVLVELGDTLLLVPMNELGGKASGVRGDLSAQIDKACGSDSVPRPEGGLRPIAAVLRAAAISGAAARVLDMCISYANERVQFGKPIGRQQAIQQQLAVMSEHVVATRIAVEMACSGAFPPSVARAATAKSVASSSAALIANTAHAVHGAIGISEEYDLQLFTRRLHEWRLADGAEDYWNETLGRLRLSGELNSVDWVRVEVFA